MNRRNLILWTGAGAAATALGLDPALARTHRTKWTVRDSEGFDALYFMGPLAGDPFLTAGYEAELKAFKPRLAPQVTGFLAMGDKMAKAKGAVLSAVLCKFFCVGPDRTIDDLIVSLDNAETTIKPKLMASDDWGGDEYWATMMQLRPPLRGALVAMRDAGFAEFRKSLYAPIYAKRAPALLHSLQRLDVIPQVERLTGRRMDSNIEIIVNYFDYPRSQSLFGQRFITHHSYNDSTIFWVAGHEVIHPPFNRDGPAIKAALAVLGRDPFVLRLINERDPGVGLNGDLPGYVEECCTQALDQIVSERLGLPRTPRKYWSDGEHSSEVLAASFYGLLKADRFDLTGGIFEHWLSKAARDGRLNPESLRAAATKVLGVPPEDVFKPYKPA